MSSDRSGDASAGALSRPPTMKDVAKTAGVSKALVSMIFRDAPGPNAQTRDRVLAAAESIGYRRNRTASVLARRRTKHLGLTMAVRNTFHAELVEDAQAAADDIGYEIVLSAVSRTHDERRAVETLLEYRCEALVLLGSELPPAELARLAEIVPVVVVGRRLGPGIADVIRTSERDGMRQVVDHLVALGHRAITHIDGGSGRISAERRRGYEAAMRAHGLDGHIQVVPGGATESAGALAIESLIGGVVTPSAVTAFNDHCAAGVVSGLARARVDTPGYLSVVGYDNSPVSRLAAVDLTSVSQEPDRQAVLAVQAAVDRLDGGPRPVKDVVLNPRLVVRGSTGPARRSGARS
jgi:DNA-binding LacI/PurR family transcriptional regulator